MGHNTEDDYDDDHDDHDGPEDDSHGSQRNLPVTQGPRIPQLFRDLGLGGVSTQDTFTIKYANNTLKVAVKRSSGVSQTVQRNVRAGFRAMTQFDPAEMTGISERNAEIRRRYRAGATQQELADLFGLSQAMISRITSEE